MPIFIVGCSRSGTTLLRLMLTCHPDICIPPESGFIVKLYAKWSNLLIKTQDQIYQLCDELFSFDNKFCDWKLTKNQIEKELEAIIPFNFQEFIDAIYNLYMAQRDKKAIYWGDKNPFYIYHIKLLKSIFPKAKFIHIIRDGRAVLNSFIKANRIHGKIYPDAPEKGAVHCRNVLKAFYPFPDTPEKGAVHWRNVLKASYPFKDHTDYYEIYYEDLIRFPKKELLHLCKFLDISYQPSEMLSYPQVNASFELVPSSRLAWHTSTLKSVDISKISAWRWELKRHYAIMFEAYCGAELFDRNYRLILPFNRFRFINKALRKMNRIRGG